MTPEERDALLARPLNAILAIPRGSGAPHVTPLWFYWDGHAFYLSTTKSRAKYRHIKRHPEVALIVDDPAAHSFLAAYGHAEIVEDDRERVVSLTVPIMRKHLGDIATTRANEMEQDRVVIVLHPDRLVSRA